MLEELLTISKLNTPTFITILNNLHINNLDLLFDEKVIENIRCETKTVLDKRRFDNIFIVELNKIKLNHFSNTAHTSQECKSFIVFICIIKINVIIP